MRYFRKEGPKTPIVLKNGDSVQFKTLDGIHGYHATDDLAQIEGFSLCIKQGRGALTEIIEQDYDTEYVKKKPNSKPYVEPWREEIGGGPMGDTVSSSQRPSPAVAAAAVSEPSEQTLVTVDAPVPPKRVVGKRPQP